MTRDEVIKMAMEAGVSIGKSDGGPYPTVQQLERLVQAAYNAGADAKKIECAKLIESMWGDDGDANDFAQAIISMDEKKDDAAIRARKGGA